MIARLIRLKGMRSLDLDLYLHLLRQGQWGSDFSLRSPVPLPHSHMNVADIAEQYELARLFDNH